LSSDLSSPILAKIIAGDLAQSKPTMNPLAAEYVQVEQISNSISSAVILILSLIGILFVWLTQGLGWILWTAIGAAVLLLPLLIYSSLFWPRVVFRHACWRLDEESLEIRRGVLWKHRMSIPLGRVQHADVSQGPLLRQFGLGKLTIHTAGTSNATIDLDGLTHETALAIRDQLVKQTQSRIVT
jgi:membrane protein YdbS with pleckstrin-like domain